MVTRDNAMETTLQASDPEKVFNRPGVTIARLGQHVKEVKVCQKQ
jgi:hypothetical protein